MRQGPLVCPMEGEDQEISLRFVPSPVPGTWRVINTRLRIIGKSMRVPWEWRQS